MKTSAASLLALAASALATGPGFGSPDDYEVDWKPTSWGKPDKPFPTWGPFPGKDKGKGKWTTSTIYSTSIQTVTSCPPTIPKCPAASTVLTTVVIPVSTTVCPVTEETPAPPAPPTDKPAPPVIVPSQAPPAPPAPPTSVAPPVIVPTAPTKSIGTISPPTRTTSLVPIVTAGAAQNVQMAGGALAAIAVAAALF